MSDPRASYAVGRAVQNGKLPHPTTLACVDCGAVATAYDHYKGYAPEHWLEVQPVCDSCNTRRSYAAQATDRSTSGISAVQFRLPTWLLDELDREAAAVYRSRQGQFLWILLDRYPDAAAAHRDEVLDGARGRRLREDDFAYVWDVA